jgi:hypothetical protein
MNSRERALAILLIFVVVFGGGGFFGYQFVYVPWSARKKTLERLQKEELDKLARRTELEKQRTKLARWTSLSLPGDQETARLEYERYLTQLLNRYKITNGREITPLNVDTKSSPTIGPNKEPIYTKLTFRVKTYATMANLMAMMDEFYRTGLMHQIRNISLQRQLAVSPQAKADELDVRMTIEAMIVTGADKRPYLLPNIDRRLLAVDVAPALFPRGPAVLWAGLSPGIITPGLLAEPSRDYSAIARKNVFLGRPPKEQRPQEDGTPMWMAPRFVFLDDITQTPLRMQSVLYDRLHNVNFKLRESGTYTTFPIVRDGQASHVLDGHIVRIDDRKLYYYAELAVPEAGFGRTPPVSKPEKSELDKLVADKVVSAEDAKRVIRYDEDYWETLLRTKVLKVGIDKNRFTVELDRDSDTPAEEDEQGISQGNPVEVLRGKVVKRDDGYLYVLPEERYYELRLGESIDDSLKRKPLPADKVKNLKELAAN